MVLWIDWIDLVQNGYEATGYKVYKVGSWETVERDNQNK
jgi:hypothetical protein